MKNVRSAGTQAERMARTALRRHGLYFAKNVASLPGSPDIVFRKKRLAVFVDSDFWHCHPTRFTMPKSNARYWVRKIAGNVQRDARVDRELTSMNWRVIRIWEHDILADPEQAIRPVLRRLR